MNRGTLFWTPAVLRILVLFSIAGAIGFFFGERAALLAAIAALIASLVMQLRYLEHLSLWLDAPEQRLPDGWGAWSEIFARLYRLRREDEKIRAELAEWLARFREAMAQLPDGVAIIDDVLFLEWCNPAAEKHLGLDLARDQGMRITNLVRHPHFIDYLMLARFEKPLELEINERRYQMHLIPFQSKRRILVTHDVTQVELIDRMRRDFIANASHELRTPLTVINGFLELAVHDPDMPEDARRRHLSLMLEQGRRMQDLIEDMLSLTKLETLEFPLQVGTVNMVALLEDVRDNAVALSAGHHEVKLIASGPDIRGSTDELRSAFLNLATNAVRYTPEGGTVTLEWKNTDTGPEFSVTDTGIGIAPEHVPRLTERFYRVDKSRSRETRGTGLGLAIVKHVMMRHGGVLDIKSTPGRGSVFTARFPRLVVASSD
ncbi:phosphate regulon sensor histidine kinase PhoR [Lacisediminimonas profundi]|uniref:phosphate regulon sensor histidine kinase PhoR n=1 Tax=Lacisediminimonas profundi TaxID=2603856 RepID=UPI00124B5E90|nr:phosphate regulon sensor histidine kinase PhoR [Lacisediminimonas profundi]